MKRVIFSLCLLIASHSSHAFDLGGFSGILSGGSEDDSGLDFDIGEVISGAKDISRTITGIDEEDEIEIGRDAAAVLLGASKPVNNPELQRYVNRIGRWVVSQTDRPHLPWRFAVLESTHVNAFATPGGYVFITNGLFKRLNNEAELAGVLAHEVAHVIRKHHINAMSKFSTSGLSGVIKLASQTGGARDNRIATEMVNQVKDIYLRGLDKDDEFEADQLGTLIAARAGYDPYGLMAVLQSLDSIHVQDSSLALLYKTHPPAADRLEKLAPTLEQMSDTTLAQPTMEARFSSYASRK